MLRLPTVAKARPWHSSVRAGCYDEWSTASKKNRHRYFAEGGLVLSMKGRLNISFVFFGLSREFRRKRDLPVDEPAFWAENRRIG